jgi:hypothetical protein
MSSFQLCVVFLVKAKHSLSGVAGYGSKPHTEQHSFTFEVDLFIV